MDEIRRGNVVRLNSGGPDMRVRNIDNNRIADCHWFVNNVRKCYLFPLVCLTKIK